MSRVSPPQQRPDARPSELTELLRAWRAREPGAEDRLVAAIYPELHEQARRALNREDTGHTLQPTALLHEAWLRLDAQRGVHWKNRSHFFGIAAQVMRRVLVDHARARLAAKRGAGAHRISLSGVPDHSATDGDLDLLALHEALDRLEALDPAQARVVELRYFAGLSIEETADALDVSPATVKREWATARAWLKRELLGA